MATHHGKNGVIKIGTNTVAEVTQFTYTRTADVAEDSAMGDTDKSYLGGLIDGSGSITCWYDPSDTNGQDALVPGSAVTLLLYPEDGAGTGETEWSVPAVITEWTLNVERDGVNTLGFSFQSNGAPTEGVA